MVLVGWQTRMVYFGRMAGKHGTGSMTSKDGTGSMVCKDGTGRMVGKDVLLGW